tara:strand:+ start:778 stop:951 length:174 start_codon:yes stop_codon:yes gene_type:complete
MTLQQKIIALYPELTDEDFEPIGGTISIHDDSNGKGAYIKEWNHPTLAKPTDEELQT